MACCPGDVGAQTGRRQEIESLEEAGRVILRARDRHPAGAVAGDAVGLREAVERQAQQIRGKCCQRDVLGVVVEDLVVDLVGEQQKLMLACQIDQLLQNLHRVHRTRGGVVRVDDEESLGLVGDLGFDIGDIGIPVVGLVAEIVDGRASGQARHRSPQGG